MLSESITTAAIRYGSLIRIAAGVQPDGTYGQTEIDAIQALGYRPLQTVFADDLATDMARHAGGTVAIGFVALSPTGEMVVVLRGTATILEWIHDAEFNFTSCPVAGPAGLTQEGFSSLYKSMRIGQYAALDYLKGLLNEAKTVTVCGHSLGAALATLIVLDVATNTACHAPTCYTFGSPRVGDHQFVQNFNAAVKESYRLANRLDMVTKLPTFPYEHVDTHYELVPDVGKINWSVPCMHHMTTYLWLLGAPVALDKDCGR